MRIHSWNHTYARVVAHELGMSCFAKNNLSLSLPLPVGDATDFGMGYSQSEFLFNLCVNVRFTRVFAAPVRGRPQGRVVPFGGARQGSDRRLRTAVSSADRAESLGL